MGRQRKEGQHTSSRRNRGRVIVKDVNIEPRFEYVEQTMKTEGKERGMTEFTLTC